MKVLVVLVAACLASSHAAYSGYSGPLATPQVNPNGFLVDTPEVAAAKAAHFSEVAKVSSPSGYAPGPYNGAPAPQWNAAPAAPQWNPAPAAPQWNAAPAAPQWNAAPAAPAWNAAPQWNAAPAAPAWNAAPATHYAGSASLNPQGFLADTPEIAAAKAAHFAELAKVQSKGSAEQYDDGSYRPEYDSPSAAPQQRAYAPAPSNTWSAPAAPSWNSAPSHAGHYAGPQATPQVTPQGFLADTPEVAAAKAAHFSEVARAGSHSRYRRHAVLPYTAVVAAPHVVAAPAPALVTYAHAPYLAHYPRSWGYSVSSW